MPLRKQCAQQQPRRAAVLLAVLVVIVLLSLAAYRYHDWMTAEFRAADSSIRATQARALADSGIHYAAAMLAANDSSSQNNPYDNSALFQSIAVSGGSDKRPGKFSIVSPRSPDDSGSQSFRYGVSDESAKINLNALLALDNGKGDMAQKILLLLPNMTEDIANAILDWLDPSSQTPRPQGAKSDYYQGLNPPYQCKNGPLDSLEELLLVKGVTPQLLFGNDVKRNGGVNTDQPDSGGTVDLGWSAYLTVYSRESNVDSEGNPRIYINDPDLTTLSDKLSTAFGQDMADFIIAYRTYGPAPAAATNGRSRPTRTARPGRGGGSGGTGSGRTPVVPRTRTPTNRSNQGGQGGGGGRGNTIKSLYDLINASVNIPSSTPGGAATPLPSPLNDSGQQRQLLPPFLDKATTTQDTDLMPRININTASQAVVAALKDAAGLTDSDISTIVARRPSSSTMSSDPLYQTPAWLITEANITPAVMKKLEKLITGRTQVYRLQSVGFFEQGGPTARVEAVIDVNRGKPRISYYRDLTELGKGFDLGNNSSP
jgi:type II secretory pathway component PulK